MGFDSFSSAAAMRDLIEKIAAATIDQMRPNTRIGAVVSINPDQYKCEVQFVGDPGTLTVRFTPSMIPKSEGVIVRVAGKPGDYYIQAVLNDNTLSAEYEPVKEDAANAVTTANAADAAANAAAALASSADDKADLALTTVGSKNQIWYFNSVPPSGGTYTDGDIAMDRDNGYQIYEWDEGTTQWIPRQFGSSAISAASVLTEHISASAAWIGTMAVESLDSGTLSAEVTVSGKLTTRVNNTGAGWVMTSAGLYAYDSGNVPVVSIPSNIGTGIKAQFKGDIETAGLLVNGGLTLRGATNEISRQSALVIAQSTTASSSTPSVDVTYENVAVSGHQFPAGFTLRSMWWRSDLGQWQIFYSYGSNPYRGTVIRVDTAGNYISTSDTISTYTGVVARCQYMPGPNEYYYVLYTSNGNQFKIIKGSNVQDYALHTIDTNGAPGLGLNYDSTRLVFGEYDGSSSWIMHHYDSNLNYYGINTLSSAPSGSEYLQSILQGVYDWGEYKWVIQSSNAGVSDICVWSAVSSARNSTYDWPKSDGSGPIAYHDGNFYQAIQTGTGVIINKFETDTMVSKTETWWAGFTWKDANPTGGEHETSLSQKQAMTMKRRALFSVNVPPIPPPSDPPSTDDVDCANIYMGRGSSEPTITTMARQDGVTKASLLTNGDFEKTSISTWESNSLSGTFAVATRGLSSAWLYTGLNSLIVNWPNGGGLPSWINHTLVSTVSGQKYRIRATVYVPSGSPDVRFQIDSATAGPTSYSTKAAWFIMDWVWTSPSTGTKRFGIKTNTVPSSGQSMYVDNFSVVPIDDLPILYAYADFNHYINPPDPESNPNEFPSSTPGVIQSSGTDVTGPVFEVYGSGAGRWGPLAFDASGGMTGADRIVAYGTRTTDLTGYTTETLLLQVSFTAVNGAVYKVECMAPMETNTATAFSVLRTRFNQTSGGITGTVVTNQVLDHRASNRRESATGVGYFTASASGTTYVKMTCDNNNTGTSPCSLNAAFVLVTKVG